ncbi:MAG: RlmE family RNA methyltransferase [Neisseriaceae bacterium]
MAKKNKFNQSWVSRHVNDHYVNLAQKEGYRSRAAYKLLEIDDKDHILKDVACVVDLGCAPGSWSQVVVQKIMHKNKNGVVIGVDLLEIDHISNMNFIQGDFTQEDVYNKLIETLNGRIVDLIISDIAPNLSGIRGVDQAKMAYLVELVFDFAVNYLRDGGNALIKVFQGGEFENLIKMARNIFTDVQIKKPLASRSESKEMYLLCKNKRLINK